MNFSVKLRSNNKTLKWEVPHFFKIAAASKLSAAFIIMYTIRENRITFFRHTILKRICYWGCKTVVSLCAFSNINSRLISFGCQTEGPAAGLGSAFLLAVLKSWNAFWVFLASSPLVRAFLLNALLRVSKDKSCWGFRRCKAVVSLCAFSNINSRLISFGCQAECPAAGLGSAFLLTVLKSWNTFWVFLASGPLVRAFLLNALLRIFQFFNLVNLFLNCKS